jgi:hypothetical protein
MREPPLPPPARTAIRGVVAAMAMTGLRRITTGLGLLKETPPEEVAERGLPSLFSQVPPRYREEAIELAHWTYGAAAGAAFAALPDGVRRRSWSGPAYGLGIWLAYEVAVAPLLGLRVAERTASERAMVALDHVLYGAVVGAQPRSP